MDWEDTHHDDSADLNDTRVRVREPEDGCGVMIVRERYCGISFDTDSDPPTRDYDWSVEESFDLYNEWQVQQVTQQFSEHDLIDLEVLFKDEFSEFISGGQ